MKRITSFTALTEVLSAFLNRLQDLALGIIAASKNQDLGAYSEASASLIWQATGTIAASTMVQIDDVIDWRDRAIWGECFRNEDDGAGNAEDNNRIGGTTDYNLDWKRTGNGSFDRFAGYVGTGAYSSLAGAAVSNANPPVFGAGAKRSYFVNLSNTGDGAMMLFADPVTGTSTSTTTRGPRCRHC
jgi:hypothetical protein